MQKASGNPKTPELRTLEELKGEDTRERKREERRCKKPTQDGVMQQGRRQSTKDRECCITQEMQQRSRNLSGNKKAKAKSESRPMTERIVTYGENGMHVGTKCKNVEVSSPRKGARNNFYRLWQSKQEIKESNWTSCRGSSDTRGGAQDPLGAGCGP